MQSKRKKKKAHYSSSASLAVTGVYYHPSSPTALQEMLMSQTLTCLNDLIHGLDFFLWAPAIVLNSGIVTCNQLQSAFSYLLLIKY